MKASVTLVQGIHVFVNAAGGAGFYSNDGLLARGGKGDVCTNDNTYAVTRINLIDAGSVDVDVLAFGQKADKTTSPRC